MKIKRSAFGTRTVKAQLIFEDEDGRKTEEFRVVYRVMTPARQREIGEMTEQAEEALKANPNDSDAKKIFASALALIVASIPDIVEDDGETPVKVTAELLDETFDWTNLNSINDAITADVNPQTDQSAS